MCRSLNALTAANTTLHIQTQQQNKQTMLTPEQLTQLGFIEVRTVQNRTHKTLTQRKGCMVAVTFIRKPDTILIQEIKVEDVEIVDYTLEILLMLDKTLNK